MKDSDSQIKVQEGLFSKMWLDNYLRAKATELTNKEKSSILNDFEDQKHQLITRFGADIFDLNHNLLTGLKSFLAQFKD